MCHNPLTIATDLYQLKWYRNFFGRYRFFLVNGFDQVSSGQLSSKKHFSDHLKSRVHFQSLK